MQKSLLSILFISFLCLAFSVTDINPLKFLILNRLKEYTSEKYPEKIYVHTDKPFYTAGEDIWFSAYLVNGITHIVSAKSSVVHVELLDYEGNMISEKKLFAESVSVQGDFKLPLELKDGTYILRAYTNYMQNHPRDFFFEKEISVYSLYADETDIEKDKEAKASKIMELPDIGFYPEGGYLVTGLKNKVAVKIKDADVDAFPILGIIEDMDGNKITDFQTFEFGLGFFYLTPELGKEYRAVISSEDEDILYSLPLPLAEGYVMNSSISDKELSISITTNRSEGLKNTLVLGHQRGIPIFDYIEKENKNTILLRIPKTDLTEGILDIVLFNDSKNPVAERLVYVKKDEKVTISINKTNGNFTTIRDRVNLKVEVKDSVGKTIPSSLSLSITDAKLIRPDKNEENIRTYLLLNSDLRGTIKSPNYFFTAGDEVKKNAQLDLIMLTHGWRRFDWQALLETWSVQKFKPEDGIYFSGYTINSKSPYQNKFSETKLTLRQVGFYQESQNTDKNGRFNYGPIVFNDTIDIIFQAGEELASEKPDFTNTNIILDPPLEKPRFTPSWTTTNAFKQEITKDEVYREKSRKSVVRNFKFDKDRELLDEVTITGKVETKEEIKHERRQRRTRTFEPTHRIIVDDMGTHGSGDFLELIQSIPGIQVTRIWGAETSQEIAINLNGKAVSLFLDNVKVDLEVARGVNQSNIDFIDILNNSAAGASSFAFESGNVIAIYTKEGSREGGKAEKKPGSITFQASGFYTARSFYSPDYSKVERNRSMRDSRSTLYWNPTVNIYSYKDTDVTFYTHDEKGSLHIEVQGITNTGIPVYTTALLEIE